ncbi:putative Zn finger-like uncharacterized protein [Halospina denitrificans]|uniref:Putative Zn finger-like uncharacterized protein n=1 Tax=Halospina denitrificans TaxID=332522 RepID=A0A4R7JQJ3_9GAMM|nr:DUF3426 domain-containing protein [Halospina denitrificans]TDT40185.1 putative Zn finger-like uncharacterized protein [Halospina denitrificans]
MSSTPDTLTRCPHCETRFRVTKKQLAAASGKVRCGHCLRVFNAIEHAQPEEPETQEPEPQEPAPQQSETQKPAPQEPEAPETETPENDEDLVFDDNPEEDAAEGRYAGRKPQSDEDDFSEALLDMERGETPDFYDAPAEDEEVLKEDDDDSWAESLLQEEEHEMPDPSPLENERASLSQQPKPDRMVRQQPEPSTTESEPSPEPTPENTASKEPVWANLNSSPVAPPRVDRSPERRRWFWGLTALIAAGLLVYQLGWQHFERLALYEPLRPWVASACNLAGCELPPLRAADKIKSRELVVRSHPDQDNALLLEVTILNQAGFDQPYPAIALSFSNLNNDIVAQRVFQPEDYLGDSALAAQSLPANQGRRIRLALRDPGKDAINYRIDFLPSQ